PGQPAVVGESQQVCSVQLCQVSGPALLDEGQFAATKSCQAVCSGVEAIAVGSVQAAGVWAIAPPPIASRRSVTTAVSSRVPWNVRTFILVSFLVYGWTGEGRFPCGSGFLREIPHQCRIPPATNRCRRPRTCSPVNAPERNRAA